MADDIINAVKKANKDKYLKNQQDFQRQSLALRAEAAPKLMLKADVYEDAIRIQGNVIYKKTIENDGLRKQIGNVDEKKLEEYTTWRTLNDTDNTKNKVIYDELLKEINMGKMLT